MPTIPTSDLDEIRSRFACPKEIPDVRVLMFQRKPNPDPEGDPILSYKVQFRRDTPSENGDMVDFQELTWEETAIALGMPESMLAGD